MKNRDETFLNLKKNLLKNYAEGNRPGGGAVENWVGDRNKDAEDQAPAFVTDASDQAHFGNFAHRFESS
jgi:hypothetical protein